MKIIKENEKKRERIYIMIGSRKPNFLAFCIANVCILAQEMIVVKWFIYSSQEMC